MAYEYTWIDGCRVEVHVAAAFRQMAAAFQARWGLTLHVKSGVRTEQEQWDLYWGWVKRLPGFNLAVKPSESFHCEIGPQGPRALDLYDSGADAGASVAGSPRNNWIRDNAPRWGITLSGLTFNPREGWHVHFTGVIGGHAAGGSTGFPAREAYGADWVIAGQRKLARLGLYSGEIDGWDGGVTQLAAKALQKILGVTEDGVYGPVTNAGADLILAGGNFTSRPVAEIQAKVGAKADGVWGPLTSLAVYVWQKLAGLVADAQWGPASDAKAFPPLPEPDLPVGENQTSRPTSEIQELLARLGLYSGKIDNDYGPGTTAAVLAFQRSQGIVEDGDWGRTSDGLGFPPAGSIHGVDYSFARPDPEMLAKRGVKLAGRYLWNLKYQDGRTNKGIGLDELLALRSRGIDPFFIYEEDGKELLGGFAAGVRVARAAEAFLTGLGLAGHPIYFNVDYDAPAADLPAILAALDGVASVIGLGRVGLYAGYGPMQAAFDAGKIKWGFQTYAWSGGKWDPRAQLQQWSNGQWGGTVDFTRATVAEFGQNPVVPVPLPDPDPEPDPDPDVPPVGVVVSPADAAALVAKAAELAAAVASKLGRS
jgi:peptidoglycan hydrolase-like protein with peptidoglycan-binding domain